MNITDFSDKSKQLVDDIKGICSEVGLGGDANEYKIVTQAFLYKFLNDKFLFEISKINPNLKSYEEIRLIPEDDYSLLLIELGTKAAHFKPEHLLENLFKNLNSDKFAKLFDDTLNDIAVINSDVFSVHTAGDTEIRLFEERLIQGAVHDISKHDETARKLINKLSESKFNFEYIFSEGFDFFSILFEYMIKDYNKDGGGKYAEYYTPHSIAKVMAEILVGNESPSNVKVYDPSAGSGTLLMNIAYKIGSDKCSVYSQDISQKSSNLLRLNLILNNLSHSIDNIIQANTIIEPKHLDEKFDYIVSNPPFDPQTSKEEYEVINTLGLKQKERFPFGVPNLVSDNKSETGKKMYIYLLFLQHVLFSLNENGKAAIVVPTGFLTANNGIALKIREELIKNKWLKGAISMPSNIFATTGTNVSIILVDKANKEDVVLIDASKVGTKIKEGGSQKTILSRDEEQKIAEAFINKKPIIDFCVKVSYEQIKEKNYSFSAGQYFLISIKNNKIDEETFYNVIENSKENITNLFNEAKILEQKIYENLKRMNYEKD